MKRIKNISINAAIVLLIALFASCEDWNLKGMRGEGPVVSEDVNMPEVEGIILEIPATVYIEKGEEQSIRIDAQQNILDNIIRTTDNGLLKLYFDEDVSRCEAIKVYMTVKSLKGLDIRGSGEIISNANFISEENLYLNVSGSGDIIANADATEVDLSIYGSGNIQLKTNCTKLYSTIEGSGDISLEGNGKYAEFYTSGSGDVHAFNFGLESSKVKIIASGNTELTVSDLLAVNIEGSGDVYYKGTPSLSVIIAGSGNIIDAN
jgi:hypothetical protein